MSFDVIDNWKTELDEMNKGKEGRQYQYPESFMKLLGYARAYFGLPYRQTQGMIQAYSKRIPKVPNYSSINRRINKLDIKVNPKVGDDIVIAIDSTGIKVANRDEWMRHKWKTRRGFLKIHVGIDIKSKKIVSYKITDEHSHDAQHLPSLVEQAGKHQITKVLADGAYDSRDNFSYLYHNGIIPAIRVRKNPTGKARGCHSRKMSVISQLLNYNYWRDSVSYGNDGLSNQYSHHSSGCLENMSWLIKQKT